jgi:polyhydroxybutyrate depolymerase
MVLHGGGGAGGSMEWLTREGFNRIADRDGVIIAYPDGIKHHWNDGRFDPHAKSGDEAVDDIGFLRALPREISNEFSIDPKRVYATGISNGGLMSYRLACDAADVFAAVAPVAANMSEALGARCKPSRPISLAIFNGVDDPIMPWKGGPIKVLWFDRGIVLSTAATQARWLELDQCAPPHPDGTLINAVPNDGTTILKHTAQCAAKTEVVLYEIQGGGHTWPGGEPYLGKRLVGTVSQEIDANQAIWQFLRRYQTGPGS